MPARPGRRLHAVDAMRDRHAAERPSRRLKKPQRGDRAPVPAIWAIVGSIVSVQGGASMAKVLFPLLGAMETVGLRVGISAVMLLAAFRPRLRRTTAAQWRAVIPYGVVLGVMNVTFYLALARIPLGLAVTVEFVGPLGVAVFGSRRAASTPWAFSWRSPRPRAGPRTS